MATKKEHKKDLECTDMIKTMSDFSRLCQRNLSYFDKVCVSLNIPVK